MATPRVPPFISDLVLAGFWAASAVKVTGYTWAAFSSTWSQLPNPNGQSSQSSGGTATTTDKIIETVKKGDSIYKKITDPVTGAVKWFDKTDNKFVNKIPILGALNKGIESLIP